MQGIDGTYIKYRPELSPSAFALDDTVSCSPGQRAMMSSLSECGWLYRHLQSTISLLYRNREAMGLVMQAFLSAVEVHLAEYYRMIAVLETKQKEMTLRKLFLSVAEPLSTLQMLAVVVDACVSAKGGALISTLTKYAAHGDPRIERLVQGLLTASMAPLLSMVHAWLFRGALDDPKEEFFVTMKPGVSQRDMWYERYALNDSMVPSFIRRDVAQRILLVGKSLHFLRESCQDPWSVPSSLIPDTINVSQLDAVVTDVSRVVNARLLALLSDKHHLHAHLGGLKRYLLLGQGDFVAYLMEVLSPELSKPASQVLRHNVLAVLESAVRGSNAQFDDSFVLESLDVRLAEEAPGDEGWDVFSLDYRVPPPLDTIFTKTTMLKYLRIFSLLWKLKRVELGLGDAWKRHMVLFHTMHARRDADILVSLARPISTLRNEAAHCISNLQYYLMFEVMECAWSELETQLAEAKDLDDLIAAHNAFLDSVLKSALLGEHTRTIREKLRELVRFVLRALAFEHKIYIDARNEIERRDAAQEKVEKKKSWTEGDLEDHGDESDDDLDALDVNGFPKRIFLTVAQLKKLASRDRSSEMSEYLAETSMDRAHVTTSLRRKIHPAAMRMLEDMQAQFRKLFLELLRLIASQRGMEILKFLAFRMDFNEFYLSGAMPSPSSSVTGSPATEASSYASSSTSSSRY
jgi:gamma-tubulin complex component 3